MKITEEQKEKFWKAVIKTQHCWIYRKITAMPPSLYGIKCTRLAWILTNGPISKGLFVLHKCNNPICVRPDHMYLGTQSRNMQDVIDRNRKQSSHFEIDFGKYLSIKAALGLMRKNGIQRTSVWLRSAIGSGLVRSVKYFNSRVVLKEDILKIIVSKIKKENI